MMRRITSKEIQEAYELTGLKPKRLIFYHEKANVGSPLTALAFSKDLSATDIRNAYCHPDNFFSFEKVAEECVMDYLQSDYQEAYLKSFTAGFNQYDLDKKDHADEIGFFDGYLAANYLFERTRDAFYGT